MKLRTVLPMLAVATFALAACASKVDYAEFNKKAKEAAEKAKDVSFSEVVLKGNYVDEDGKKQKYDEVKIKFTKGIFELNSVTDATNADALSAVGYLNFLRAAAIPESEDLTYYAGTTFKVVYEKDDKKTVEFSEYGLLTSVKDSDSKLTISYKK